MLKALVVVLFLMLKGSSTQSLALDENAALHHALGMANGMYSCIKVIHNWSISKYSPKYNKNHENSLAVWVCSEWNW